MLHVETRPLTTIAGVLASGTLSSLALAAGIYYVDVDNPACATNAPGTELAPYCSIYKAARDRGGPDTTILVKPGVYRESVVIERSGSAGHPFIVRALGPSVVMDASLDYSSSSMWSHYAGNVWVASGPYAPVWVDGALLSLGGNVPPEQLQPGQWTHVFDCSGAFCAPALVYVNIGGGNPGDHETFIEGLSGFRLCGRHFVTIDGFTLVRSRGFHVYCGSSHISIVNNVLTYGTGAGIHVEAGHDFLVRSNVVSRFNGHGIYFLPNAVESVIEDNESFANASTLYNLGDVRGIRLEGTRSIKVLRNRLHHNQGTGLHLDDAIDTISFLNRSWANGENGYAHLYSQGTLHSGDVAWGNLLDGFSVEGGSTATILNSISADNGLTSGRFDLFVDSTSASAGVASNHNILWNSTSQAPIRRGSASYASVAAYASASGQDLHSFQASPRFVDPAAGDFHLQEGSPAIDSADSSALRMLPVDAEGTDRLDDPATPNTGPGSVAYSDRGALEFRPPCSGGVGLACGSNIGVCAPGTAACVDELLACSGTGGPSEETCDGLDNDCDGAIDNGEPSIIGSPSLTIGPIDEHGRAIFTWTPVPGATRYDVIRGSLGRLRSSDGDFSQSVTACIRHDYEGGTTVPWYPSIDSDPTATWYLVRGKNSLCAGSYDSDGPGQVGARDEEIGSAVYPCP